MSECSPKNDYKMLILKCQNSEAEDHEVCSLESVCKLMGITPVVETITSLKHLGEILKQGVEYNFIYLSAHGDADVFSSEEFKFEVQWKDFANMLCITDAMAEDCIIMLSCCRGGLAKVAYTIFYMCCDVQYVVGPRHNLTNCEMSTAFHIFMFNHMERRHDPVVACEKVAAVIDTRLICYDRLEQETTSSYVNFVETNFESDGETYQMSPEAQAIIKEAEEKALAEFMTSSGEGKVCCPAPAEAE